MSFVPGIWRVFLGIMALVLLVLAWQGVSGGLHDIPRVTTKGQLAQVVSQFAYAVFAVLSVGTTFVARRWNRLMLGGFVTAVAFAAGIASVAWGGTPLVIGFVSGAGGLLIGLLFAWLLRRASRGVAEGAVSLPA